MAEECRTAVIAAFLEAAVRRLERAIQASVEISTTARLILIEPTSAEQSHRLPRAA